MWNRTPSLKDGGIETPGRVPPRCRPALLLTVRLKPVINRSLVAACSPDSKAVMPSIQDLCLTYHGPRIHEQKNSKVSNRYIRYVKQTEIWTLATHVNG